MLHRTCRDQLHYEQLDIKKITCESELRVVDIDVGMAGYNVADSHKTHHGRRRGCTVAGCLLEYHTSGVDLAHKQGPAVLALYYEGGADDANRAFQYVGGHDSGERDGVVGDGTQW